MTEPNEPKSKLDETRDFLKLYIHQCGLFNPPRIWHLWSGLSLMAACCGNNFWVNTMDKKLYPNLYVFLVGGSGTGKGYCINIAESFLEDNVYSDQYVHMNSVSNITKQGMTDHLIALEKVRDTELIHGSRMWLITEEMVNPIPAGPMAMEFIKHVTEFFDGTPGKKYDLTRGGGSLVVKAPMINWLAGTTEEWLFDSLDSTAVSGGFFARATVVWGEKERDIPKPIYPWDKAEVKKHIQHRVDALCRMKSELVPSPEANQYIEYEWWPSRTEPDDEDLKAMWNREMQIVWKLAMLACLSGQLLYDKKLDPVIQEHHVRQAVEWLADSRRNIDRVLMFANKTRETIPIDAAFRIIEQKNRVQRSFLINRLSKLGVKSGQLNEIIRTLVERDKIEIEVIGNATFYKLKKRRAF